MQNTIRRVLVIMVASILLATGLRFFNTTSRYAATEYPMYSAGWWQQRPEFDKLSADDQILMVSMISMVKEYGYDATATQHMNSGKWKNILETIVLPYGYMAEYEKSFKDRGMIDANYSRTNSKIGGGTKATTQTAADTQNTAATQTKTEFTVTEVDIYTAWTTQDCNIRSGADVSYEKVGNLKKHEQVTVTGQASTGWFRITTSDGKEAYISDTLITTEDPRNREYTTVDDSGDVTTYKFEDTPPEVIDNIIEEIENKTEEEKPHEHSYTSEVTKEATCTEKGILTYTCECGDTYTEEIPLAEHAPGKWEITKKATMLSDGEQVKKCTVCGEVLETAVIPANKTLLYILIAAGILVLGSVVGIVLYRRNR